MKLVRTFSMIIALAGASTAYAQAPKAPAEKKAPAAPAPDKAAPKAELSKAEVEKVEKFFNELYDAVMKNQTACPKMAAGINATLDKHQDWFKKMVESGKEMPQASKDKLATRQQEMGNGIMKCKDDKDVQASMQRLMGLASAKKVDKAEPPPPAKKP